MANAKLDQNHVPTWIAVLNTDGSTVVPVQMNPSNNRLKISDAMTGNDNGPTNAVHDENHVTTLVGVSSVDFTTPVVIYADSNGKLLVNSQ